MEHLHYMATYLAYSIKAMIVFIVSFSAGRSGLHMRETIFGDQTIATIIYLYISFLNIFSVSCVHFLKSACFIRIVVTALLEYVDLFIKRCLNYPSWLFQNKFSLKPGWPMPFRPYLFLWHCIANIKLESRSFPSIATFYL